MLFPMTDLNLLYFHIIIIIIIITFIIILFFSCSWFPVEHACCGIEYIMHINGFFQDIYTVWIGSFYPDVL